MKARLKFNSVEFKICNTSPKLLLVFAQNFVIQYKSKIKMINVKKRPEMNLI